MIVCKKCGRCEFLMLPMPIHKWTATVLKFQRQHAGCAVLEIPKPRVKA
jgi:hypothetical protein